MNVCLTCGCPRKSFDAALEPVKFCWYETDRPEGYGCPGPSYDTYDEAQRWASTSDRPTKVIAVSWGQARLL